MADTFTIEVLKDGSLKIETEAFSAANHMTAEAFLKNVEFAGGEKALRQRRAGAHLHMHTHGGTEHAHA